MNKKIVEILIMILLIATAVPAVAFLNNIDPYYISSTNIQGCSLVNWNEIQKLLALDGSTEDYFGVSVSIDGDTALIGAMYDDDLGSNSGSVYAFTRNDTTWIQQQKLTASDGAEGDSFGYSISVVGDTALIGAYGDDFLGSNSGSVYVFTRIGTIWKQQQKLTASDGVNGDHFGVSVSLDGDTALIGADGDDDLGIDSGSAYVFTRIGLTWIQQQKLTASDGAAWDYFGVSVSLDGDTALIGAHRDEDEGIKSGSAYVFTRNDTTWIQQQKLTASDGSSTEDYFGVSVSLDGDTALIGAHRDEDEGIKSGSAYVFTRNDTTWTQQAKLLASDGAEGDYFGFSVSLSGNTALIGVFGDDSLGSNSGSAYVFNRNDTTWTQQQKLTASDGAEGDYFGISVFINVDNALIGAHGTSNKGSNSGSTYLFKKENQLPHTPSNPNPANNSINIDINADLSWAGGDPDNRDIVTYDIYFGINSNPPLHKTDYTTTIYDPGSMNHNTKYYWKIVTKDNHGATITGSIWHFTTIEAPNNPPIKPNKPSGLISGKIGIIHTYSSSTTDPDDDNVYYWFDWGDGTNSGWDGPYHSGDSVFLAHAWASTGTYPIKVKAKDINGAESVWSDSFSVTMTKNKMKYQMDILFERLNQWFSFMGKILS